MRTTYEGVSKNFRTGRLERELKMVQLSDTRCSCIAPQRVFIVVVYFVMTQSGNFWIHPCITTRYWEIASANQREVRLHRHGFPRLYQIYWPECDYGEFWNTWRDQFLSPWNRYIQICINSNHDGWFTVARYWLCSQCRSHWRLLCVSQSW
jgi:hypothetical protein